MRCKPLRSRWPWPTPRWRRCDPLARAGVKTSLGPAAAAAGAPPVQRHGRFELRRLLGRGAQASVWLAYDPRLDREVALKLLNTTGLRPLGQWLDEARAVSRLTHPNVVPVFEADEGDGQPYLVFERVDGGTLADAQRGRGPWPAAEAVALMLGVLDGLAAAHSLCIVHRDLKPSNILLGADGRPRVMDFGIAARVAGSPDGLVAGTPGYIAPEAARGEPPAPSMDVFAAGLVLAELLCGRPLLRERDACAALARVQNEDLSLPDDVLVDDTLRGIVARALARDPARRHDTARSLHAALAAWAQPAEAVALPGGHDTLVFLLRRMRRHSDFPAMSGAIVRIQRLTSSETESLHSLSAEILQDVALTHKLLRLVNSASYLHAGGGTVSTVSRAVSLVGFGGIRNLALSLVLLEQMQNKAQVALLQQEFLRALLAATLASALTPMSGEAEEAFLGAMLRNLGRLLTGCYFPEEAQQIRDQQALAHDAAAHESAVMRVLGLSFADLGIGVARSWGLPDTLLRCMRAPLGEPSDRPPERGVERLRWLAHEGNELAELLMAADDLPSRRRLHRAVGRCAQRLALTRSDVAAALARACESLVVQARALSLSVPAARVLGRQALQAESAAAEFSERDAAAGASTSRGQAGQAAEPQSALDLVLTAGAMQSATLVLAVPAHDPTDLLVAGIQDVTASLVADSVRLDTVLRMVLETLLRALRLRRVLLAVRDARSGEIAGRVGLGDDVDSLLAAFRVALPAEGAAPTDLFAAVCQKGVDTLIDDAAVPALAARLPGWFAQASAARSFLLLPMLLKGRTFALIYGEQLAPGSIRLDERQRSLLRTLRNQALMAFRQVEMQRLG